MHYIKDNTKIYVYSMPILDSRMYIIINDENEKEALIIDPLISEEAFTILSTLSHALQYCSPIPTMTIFLA